MPMFDDLFGDDNDTIERPSFTRNDLPTDTPQDEQRSLFKRKEQIYQLMDDIKSEVENVNQLFNELGDGRIKDKLTIKRRNEIIETLNNKHQKINTLNQSIYDALNKDIIAVRGLKVTSSTNPSVFDDLLGNVGKSKLSSKDRPIERQGD